MAKDIRLWKEQAYAQPLTLMEYGVYTGEGAKQSLSKGFTKFLRLVPNQSSDEITKLFEDHFKAIAPKSVKVEVRPHRGGEPM